MSQIMLSMVLFFASFTLAAETELLIRIPKSLVEKEVKDFIPDHYSHDYYSVGYLSKEALNRLSPQTRAHVQILDQVLWAKGRYDIESLKVLPGDIKKYDGAKAYHNYQALTVVLQKLAAENPDIVSLRSAGKSVQGRDLWYVILSDHAGQRENEPVTAYIANMHGDETAGREMMIELILRLVTSYKNGDQRVRNILDHSQVLIMPSMNPDGFELRRRGNANNIDLNRNFDDPRSGPSTRIQPEVEALVRLHHNYLPTLGLNFHGGAVCFNMPWDHKMNRTNKFADDLLMQDLAYKYSSSNPTMFSSREFPNGITYGAEWYPISGGMQDWSIVYADSTHATVELSRIKWPNPRDLPNIYSENEEAMLHVLERGLFGVHLEVLDKNHKPVDDFEVRLKSSQRWIKNKGSHFVHRLSLDQMQEVEILWKGQVHRFDVMPYYFNGSFTRLSLVPAASSPPPDL